jgi:hypothetical protein
MIKYVLTSGRFEGKILFGFRGGYLAFFENSSNLDELGMRWLFNQFPFTLEVLEDMKSKISGRIELMPSDLSFDAFWEAYSKKVNRKRCEPLWKKLNDAERMTCLQSIPAYNGYLKRMNRAKLDPENYLKREAFQNPWNSLIS